MAGAYVQSAELIQTGSSAATIAKAFGSNVTAGSLLLAFFIWKTNIGGDEASSSFADSLGQTWTMVDHDYNSTSDRAGEWWYKENTAGGANTVTLTLPTARLFRGCIVAEYSGIQTASSLESSSKKNGTTATGTNGVTGNAHVPSTNGDLVVSSLMIDNDPVAIGVGTNVAWTERLDNSNGQQLQDIFQAAAASIQPAWTYPNAVDHYIAFSGSFIVAGGGGGGGSGGTRDLALLGCG